MKNKLLIVFMILFYLSCSNKNKIINNNENLPKNSDENSLLLVTFSSDYEEIKNYNFINLGIVDIILYIRLNADLLAYPLFNADTSKMIEKDNVRIINLRSSDQNSYQYQGIYPVVTGSIERVGLVFSGMFSHVVKNGKTLTLIDSFFEPLSSTGAKDGDNVNRRQVVQSLHYLNTPIVLNPLFPRVMNIEINLGSSIGIDPLPSGSESPFAVFSPVFNVSSQILMGNSLSLSFNLYQYIDMTLGDEEENVFALGNQNEKVFISNYVEKNQDNLKMNGDSVNSVKEVKGLHYINMVGDLQLSSTGYQYYLKEASFVSAEGNENKALYSGEITDRTDEYSVFQGQKYTLQVGSDMTDSLTYFKGNIEPKKTDVMVGDELVLLAESDNLSSDHVKVISHSKITATEAGAEVVSDYYLFHIRATAALPVDNLLNFKGIQLEGVSAILTFDPLDCSYLIKAQAVNATAPCLPNSSINKITLLTPEDKFTVIVTRKSDDIIDENVLENNLSSELIVYPDEIYTFTDALSLFEFIELMKEENYKLIGFSATGDLVNNEFIVKKKASFTFSYPQVALDSSLVIESNRLLDESDYPVNSKNNIIIGATLGTLVSAVGISGLITYLVKRNRNIKKYSMSVGDGAVNPDTVTAEEGSKIIPITNHTSVISGSQSTKILSKIDEATSSKDNNQVIKQKFKDFYNSEKDGTLQQKDRFPGIIGEIDKQENFFDSLNDDQIKKIVDDIHNNSTNNLDQEQKIKLIQEHGIKSYQTRGAINFPGDDFIDSLYKHGIVNKKL